MHNCDEHVQNTGLHQTSILLSSKWFKLGFVYLKTSTCLNCVGTDEPFGTYKCSLGMTWWRSINLQTHSQNLSPLPKASRLSSSFCISSSSSSSSSAHPSSSSWSAVLHCLQILLFLHVLRFHTSFSCSFVFASSAGLVHPTPLISASGATCTSSACSYRRRATRHRQLVGALRSRLT